MRSIYLLRSMCTSREYVYYIGPLKVAYERLEVRNAAKLPGKYVAGWKKCCK